MPYLKLNYSSHSEDTSEADPEDSWDRPRTSTTHIVHGLSLTNIDEYKCLPCEGVSVGDKLWCLYAIYSTGDSFGNDEGACFEWLSYHKTEKLARKNHDAIIAGASKLTLDNGSEQEFYRGWDGYFESLDSLEVLELEVE